MCYFNVIFFDDTCGVCHKFIDFVVRHDKTRYFRFAGRSSQYAKSLSEILPKTESIIFFDTNTQLFYTHAKGIFRIYWYLGFPYSLLGLLSFLPNFILFPFNLAYSAFAKRRQTVCPHLKSFKVQQTDDRFFQ